MNRLFFLTWITLCQVMMLTEAKCLPTTVDFSNKNIQQLVEKLPIRALPKKDTLMVIQEVIPDKSLVFQFNAAHEMTHIGVSLFTNETKQMLDQKICDFLERYWLELLLQKEESQVSRKLQEFHVKLSMDGQSFGTGSFHAVDIALRQMRMPVNFSMQSNDKRAKAIWAFDQHTLTLDFPLYRELIEGMDKQEADAELHQQLQTTTEQSFSLIEESVTASLLVKQSDHLYVRPGTKFMIAALSSDRYYQRLKDGSFQPLFSKDYPIQSMNNLFLTYLYGKNKKLRLTHRQYGHFTPEISLPLLSFLALFNQDFERACHTTINTKGELETIVVFVHKQLNYIHLLKTKIQEKELFGSNPVLKADFYSNIPQHYINSLLK